MEHGPLYKGSEKCRSYNFLGVSSLPFGLYSRQKNKKTRYSRQKTSKNEVCWTVQQAKNKSEGVAFTRSMVIAKSHFIDADSEEIFLQQKF
jgi:hypothetical protein